MREIRQVVDGSVTCVGADVLPMTACTGVSLHSCPPSVRSLAVEAFGAVHPRSTVRTVQRWLLMAASSRVQTAKVTS